MTTLKYLMAVGTLGLFSGVAAADEWHHDGRWNHSDRMDQRREQARIDYERRIANCGDHERCRRHARHEYRRQLSHIDRYRF
jgi:hypothetical protein